MILAHLSLSLFRILIIHPIVHGVVSQKLGLHRGRFQRYYDDANIETACGKRGQNIDDVVVFICHFL